MDSHWAYGASLFVLGIVSMVVFVTFFAEPGPDGRTLRDGGAIAVLGGAFFMLIGAMAVSGWDGRRRVTSPRRRDQIQQLARHLEDAVTAIDSIRVEVEEGRRTLEALEQQTEAQRELAKLSDPQAKAVLETLRAELNVESRRSLVQEIVVNGSFFLLGLVVARIFGFG